MTLISLRPKLFLVNKSERIVILFLRLSLGWIFLYAGFTKLANPAWTAAGFLKGSQTFPDLYKLFTDPTILPIVNFLNEWGQLLLGISLILGIGVRLSSILGAALMVLYYLPQLSFPYIGKTSFIVDQHIIFALVLIYFAVIRAGRVYGFEQWCANLPICRKIPNLRNWFG